MPIWSRLINIRYAIVDVEVGLKNHKIHDIEHSAMMVQHTTKLQKRSYLNFSAARIIYADITSFTMMPNIYSQTKHANGFWSTRFIYLLCCFRNVLTISF